MAKEGLKVSLPVYDDFGNLLSGGGGKGGVVLPKDRVMVRKQGCWNCIAFDATEIYLKRVADSFRRDVRVFMERGHDSHRARASANITKQMLLEKRGVFGVCLLGKIEGDFVACKHLCDGWSGKQGVIGGFTAGEAFDPLVEEMYDRIGESAHGVPPQPLVPEKKGETE